jgi:general stress protein 26
MATAKSTSRKKPAAKSAAARSSARKATVSAKAPAIKAAAKSSARRATARTTPKRPGRATRVNRIAPVKTSATARKSARKARKAERKEMSHIDRVWHLAERIGICMFITWDGERQRARPLAVHVKRDEHALYFLTDVEGHKDNEIERFPTVSLAFADPKRVKYVSITGKATISNDRGKIKDLWNPWAKAWWASADDPNIRVIKVSPEDAELWDSPGRIAATVAMLSAVLTGKSPKLLDNAKLEAI